MIEDDGVGLTCDGAAPRRAQRLPPVVASRVVARASDGFVCNASRICGSSSTTRNSRLMQAARARNARLPRYLHFIFPPSFSLLGTDASGVDLGEARAIARPSPGPAHTAVHSADPARTPSSRSAARALQGGIVLKGNCIALPVQQRRFSGRPDSPRYANRGVLRQGRKLKAHCRVRFTSARSIGSVRWAPVEIARRAR